MKHRILSFVVVIVFLVSMCGCNAEKTDVSGNSDTAEISSSAGKTEVVTEYEPESDTKPTEAMIQKSRTSLLSLRKQLRPSSRRKKQNRKPLTIMSLTLKQSAAI